MSHSSVERRHVFRSACRRFFASSKWKHLTAVLSSQHLVCPQVSLHPLGTPCSPQIQREMTEGRPPPNPTKDSSLNKIDSTETASALLIVWSWAADSMLLSAGSFSPPPSAVTAPYLQSSFERAFRQPGCYLVEGPFPWVSPR